MEDLFDEELLEAIRLAESVQGDHTEHKEEENAAVEDIPAAESDSASSLAPSAPVPKTGEEAVDMLIKEIVQETQQEIAAEGIQTEDIKKEFFQKKAEKSRREKQKQRAEQEYKPIQAPKKLKDPWSLRKKVCVLLILVLLVAAGIPAGIFANMYFKGKNRLEENAQGEKVSFHTDGSSSTAITYKGKNYVYNTDTVTILLFGVDNTRYEPKEPEKTEAPTTEASTEEKKSKKKKSKKKKAEDSQEDSETTTEADIRDRDDELTYTDANGSEYVRYGGRIDLCFLLVFDLRNETLRVINVNRDSMADVDIKTIKGETVLTDQMQVGLAYGYGDGETVSCENFTHAVSGLMYHLPINGYVAIDMNGIPDINDVLGGVTLTALDTVSENVFEKDVVTLQGEDAYRYLERMDTITDTVGEHAKRMERQSQYLAAWLERFGQCYSDDKGIIKKVYEAAGSYLQTNLDRDACLYLFSRMHGANTFTEETDIRELPGSYERPVHFDEYQVDPNALVEEMLEMFYIQTNG